MTVGQDVRKPMSSAKMKRIAELWIVRTPNLPVILDVRGVACVHRNVPEICSKPVVYMWVVEPI